MFEVGRHQAFHLSRRKPGWGHMYLSPWMGRLLGLLILPEGLLQSRSPHPQFALSLGGFLHSPSQSLWGWQARVPVVKAWVWEVCVLSWKGVPWEQAGWCPLEGEQGFFRCHDTGVQAQVGTVL